MFLIFENFRAIYIDEKRSFLLDRMSWFFYPIVVNYQDEIREAGQLPRDLSSAHRGRVPGKHFNYSLALPPIENGVSRFWE